MKTNLKAIASLVLVSAVSAGYAQTAPAPTHHKHHYRKAEHKPSIESQIQELQEQMDQQRNQINTLQQQLDQRTEQLQQAQTAAQQAQTAAQQAQAAASQQQQQLTDNAQAVTSLQGSVADLKASNEHVVATVHKAEANVAKMVEHPDEIHYKGVTISPHGSFIEGATVYRNKATGSGIATPFTSIPVNGADNAQLSEFEGSGRQSRLALKVTGRTPHATIGAYYEMDWLGAGVTSNNNQSNSYVLRVRQIWGQAHLDDGFIFTAGQMWSLATETSNLLDNGTEVLPGDIDPNYNAGFVWARQFGFRVVKDFSKNLAFGISAEGAQTLIPTCQAAGGTAACPKNYLIGQTGTGGGLYPSTSTYSYNQAPDFVAKVTYQNRFAHYEAFGIARFFRDRVYPTSGSATGAYNDSMAVGGIGGGARFHIVPKKFDVAIKGLYGEGIGRYGDSTIADTTVRPDGQLAPLHGFSALGEIVGHASPRFDYYVDYGADYAGRRYFATDSGYEGYGVPNVNNTGCNTEASGSSDAGTTPAGAANCGGNTKDVQELSVGFNYYFYKGGYGQLREGIQYSYAQRNLWGGIGGSPNANDNIVETSFRYYLP